MVAITVLLAGGAALIAEGMLHLLHPEPMASVRLSLGVLALSTLFEGISRYVDYRKSRRIAASHPVPGERVGLSQLSSVPRTPNCTKAYWRTPRR